MDGSTIDNGVVRAWTTPRDAAHPHQRWLNASPLQPAANYAAYRAARQGISDAICWRVYNLHDSAQHHFITMLLWDRPGLGYMTIQEALAEAVKHHKQVQKTKK